ncbi:twin-arginine translocase subunit TatC [Corynebacterium lizhenjunii]|uniref:twin-arginine translocase subunit TatC n=1 Tax=Corynebacterium lizhenjunii TaxID=2709394 RepID=UPI0039A59C4D
MVGSRLQSPQPARKRVKVKRQRKPKNPTGEMTLVEHLQELRRRLILAVAFMAAGTVVGFIWYGTAPFGLPPLGELLRGPYCSLPEHLRVTASPDGECRLLATRAMEMFMLRLKVGALAGMVLSSPFWLYQIWAFIVPGLEKRERRWTYIFVSIAALLFVAGAVMSYFFMSFGLEFLLSVGEEYQQTWLTGGDYYNYFIALIIVFGVSFEVPLIIVMLNLMGILRYEAIKGKRSIIAIALMILAAIATPADPYSMMAMSLCLWLLVELAYQFCRLNDRRRDKKRPEWMDFDDEQGSGPVHASGPIGASDPVVASGPVGASGPVAPSAAAGASASSRPTPQPGLATQPSPPPATPGPGTPGGAFDDVL